MIFYRYIQSQGVVPITMAQALPHLSLHPLPCQVKIFQMTDIILKILKYSKTYATIDKTGDFSEYLRNCLHEILYIFRPI